MPERGPSVSEKSDYETGIAKASELIWMEPESGIARRIKRAGPIKRGVGVAMNTWAERPTPVRKLRDPSRRRVGNKHATQDLGVGQRPSIAIVCAEERWAAVEAVE